MGERVSRQFPSEARYYVGDNLSVVLRERSVVHALIFREKKMFAEITVWSEPALGVPVSLLEVEEISHDEVIEIQVSGDKALLERLREEMAQVKGVAEVP